MAVKGTQLRYTMLDELHQALKIILQSRFRCIMNLHAARGSEVHIPSWFAVSMLQKFVFLRLTRTIRLVYEQR